MRKWISVKRKLDFSGGKQYRDSDVEIEVFIFDKRRGVNKATARLYLRDSDGHKTGDIIFQDDYYSFLEVSHYMYYSLPDPPKLKEL